MSYSPQEPGANIGLRRLIAHLRDMSLHKHNFYLGVFALVGFFITALWIVSLQPGEALDEPAKPIELAQGTKPDDVGRHTPRTSRRSDVNYALKTNWQGEPFVPGLEEDFERAFDGDANAQVRIALAFLEEANFVPDNEIEAFKWLLIAATLSPDLERATWEIVDLKAAMSVEEVQEGTKRAREWLSRYSGKAN